MKSKLIKVVLLLFVICLLFTGCLTSTLGVEQTIVIQSVGIDFDFKKGEYEVTMQCFDLSNTSAKGEIQGGKNSKIITAKGKSVEQAIMNTSKITGENPIYSQNRVIILGESILKNGIDKGFDVFVRDYRTRSSTPVAVARNFKAGDIVKADEKGLTAFPANTLQHVLESGEINSLTTEVTVMEFVNLCQEKTSSAYIPALSLEKKDDGIYAKINGMGIINDQKLVGFLSSDETRAMLWVINKIESGTILLENSSIGIATLEISASKTKTETKITKDGLLQYNIKIDCSLDLMEVDFRKECALDEKEIITLESEASNYIEKEVEKVIKKCLNEYKSDPFRFGKRLWVKSPESYRHLNKEWDEFLPNIKTNVSAEVKIRRVGRYGVKE